MRQGSSPLARGLLLHHDFRAGRVGIIPARAGFTSMRSRSTARSQDHPRSRGVYPQAPSPLPWVRGSSPLARGLQPVRKPLPFRHRIIPARAGFTLAIKKKVAATKGSSPLARGLLAQGVPARRLGRIIPARAGFTRAATGPPSPPGDHPRSRGVYGEASLHGRLDGGSSPLARGLPLGL